MRAACVAIASDGEVLVWTALPLITEGSLQEGVMMKECRPLSGHPWRARSTAVTRLPSLVDRERRSAALRRGYQLGKAGIAFQRIQVRIFAGRLAQLRTQ